jgi:hypothetical protein
MLKVAIFIPKHTKKWFDDLMRLTPVPDQHHCLKRGGVCSVRQQLACVRERA